jgi:hypothetical protein
MQAFDGVLGGVERGYQFCVPAASMILLALLERLPDQVFNTRYDLEIGDLAELLAIIIERGFLNGRPLALAAS